MKLYSPRRVGTRSSIKAPKLSAHIMKMPKVGKVSIKAPKFSGRGSRVAKIKI